MLSPRETFFQVDALNVFCEMYRLIGKVRHQQPYLELNSRLNHLED